MKQKAFTVIVLVLFFLVIAGLNIYTRGQVDDILQDTDCDNLSCEALINE